jgi:hypothetical protein
VNKTTEQALGMAATALWHHRPTTSQAAQQTHAQEPPVLHHSTSTHPLHRAVASLLLHMRLQRALLPAAGRKRGVRALCTGRAGREAGRARNRVSGRCSGSRAGQQRAGKQQAEQPPHQPQPSKPQHLLGPPHRAAPRSPTPT